MMYRRKRKAAKRYHYELTDSRWSASLAEMAKIILKRYEEKENLE